MTDLHHLDICQVAEAFAAKRLSPVEYAAALIVRIEAVDPSLNAFVRVMASDMMEEARKAEREIFQYGPRSPLHGIPIGVKDVIDVAGVPTTCHSKLLLDNVAGKDARVVSLLRAAGAIVAGKTATWEFALGGPSFDLPFPPARNPWNLAHHPGGSSAGSGAALGAHLVPGALGTDTGGSIRLPASHCGVVGLKPTHDLVSTKGVFPLSWTLDAVGPMTRTVRDNALMLNAMVDDTVKCGDYTSALDSGVRGLRIGVVRHFFERDTVAHPDVIAAIQSVVETLAAAGASVRDVALPVLSEFTNVLRVIMCAEGAAIHQRWLGERPGDYAELSRRRLLPGLYVSGVDYVNAQRRRTELSSAVEGTFADVDLLVTASTMDPACRIDDPVAIDYTHPRQSRVPFSLSGHPALSLRCGSSQGGLPLAVQMVGRRWGEAALYGAAAAYERLAGWSRTPPVGPNSVVL